MSAKLATLSLFKIKVLKKRLDVIMTQIMLYIGSCDQSLVNSSITMKTL